MACVVVVPGAPRPGPGCCGVLPGRAAWVRSRVGCSADGGVVPGQVFSLKREKSHFFFPPPPKKVKTNVKTNCTLTHTCLAYKKKAE